MMPLTSLVSIAAATLLAPAGLPASASPHQDARAAHCAAAPALGQFDPSRDVLIAAFDSKTDTDDFHSIAALATMLADPQLACVDYLAVAGAYGKQGGDYLPAPQLFDLAFGTRWTDGHGNRAGAVDAMVAAARTALARGGRVWVQEAGQSDLTAMMVRRIQAEAPSVDTRARVIVVQHSVWNERETTPAALEYVRAHTRYVKIPDGNTMGNGSPGFKSDDQALWRAALAHPHAGAAWAEARQLAVALNAYNGGHDNGAIREGGFDFSDAAEAVWIFGFEAIADAGDFFERFGGARAE